MVHGLIVKWKQSVGYILSNNATAADVLQQLLLECVTRMQNIGLCIRAVVCDQGPTNQMLVKSKLCITVDKPYIDINDNRIYLFYDTPHLLKSVCNNLLRKDYLLDNVTISWKYISQMYKLDTQRQIDMRLAPKLSYKHVDPPPFSLMKVKLASQVLSSTVTASITTYGPMLFVVTMICLLMP